MGPGSVRAVVHRSWLSQLSEMEVAQRPDTFRGPYAPLIWCPTKPKPCIARQKFLKQRVPSHTSLTATLLVELTVRPEFRPLIAEAFVDPSDGRRAVRPVENVRSQVKNQCGGKSGVCYVACPQFE